VCDCLEGSQHFCEERKPVARKNYRCEECGQPIPQGTQYVYLSGAFTDDTGKHFWTFRMCSQCFEDWDILSDVQYEATQTTCVVYGCLEEKVFESFDLGRFDELIETAKRPLCESCPDDEHHNFRTKQFDRRIALLKRWLSDSLKGEEQERLAAYTRPTEADGQPKLPF